MKMKKIIKKNLFGFILGAIIFGAITTVLAVNIASSTIAYTTTNNNSVATVEDALQDLYQKIIGAPKICYNGVCGKVSYKYWNNNFSSSTGDNWFDTNHMPATTYATRALLEQNYGSSNFANNPIYIRSILIDGNVVGHESCLWNNNKEFCLGTGYWAGTLNTNSTNAGTQTKLKLRRDMQDSLGVTIQDSSCDSFSAYVRCRVGDLDWFVYQSGVVNSLSKVTGLGCYVNGDGDARCGN